MSDDLKKAQEGCHPDPVENWRAKPTKDLYAALDKLNPHIDTLNSNYRKLLDVIVDSDFNQKKLSENQNKLNKIKRALKLAHDTKGHIENALMPSMSQSRRIEEFGENEKKFDIVVDGVSHRQGAATREEAEKFVKAKLEHLAAMREESDDDKAEAEPKKASGKRRSSLELRERAQARKDKARNLAMAHGTFVPVKTGTVKGQERYTIFDKDGNEVPVPALIDRLHGEGHPQAGELKHIHQRKQEAIQAAQSVLRNLKEMEEAFSQFKRKPSRKDREAAAEKRDEERAQSLLGRIENSVTDDTHPNKWDHFKNSILKNSAHTMTPGEYRNAVRMYYNAVGDSDARGPGKTSAENTIHQFYQKKLSNLRKDSKNYKEGSKPLIEERDALLSQIKDRMDPRRLNEEHDDIIVNKVRDYEREQSQLGAEDDDKDDTRAGSGVPTKVRDAALKRVRSRKSRVIQAAEKLEEDLPADEENLREKHAPMVAAVDKHFEGLSGDKSFNPPTESKRGESPSEVLAREGYQPRNTSEENEENELRPWVVNKYRKLLGGEHKTSSKNPDQHFPDVGELSEFLGDDAQEAQAEWEQVQKKLSGSKTGRKEKKSPDEARKEAAKLDEAREGLAKKWAKRFSTGRVGTSERMDLVARMRGEKAGNSGDDLEDFIQEYSKQSRDRGKTGREDANLGLLKEWVKDLKVKLGSARNKAFEGQEIPLGESDLSEKHTVFKDRYKEKESQLLEDIIGRLRQDDQNTPFSVLSKKGKQEIEELVRKSFDWTYGMFTDDVFPGVFLELNMFKNFNASEKDKVRAFENSFGRDTRGVNPSTMNSEIEGREEDEDSENKKSKLDKSLGLGLYVRC